VSLPASVTGLHDSKQYTVSNATSFTLTCFFNAVWQQKRHYDYHYYHHHLLLLAITVTIITSHVAKIWTYSTCGLLPAKIIQCYKPTTPVCASRVHMACTTRSIVPLRPADVCSTTYCVSVAKDSYRDSVSAT